MRCKNCGWDNTAGISKCEKCNALLENEGQQNDLNNEGQRQGTLDGTLQGQQAKGDFWDAPEEKVNKRANNQTAECPQCGYKNRPGVSSCSNCNCALTSPPNPITPSSQPTPAANINPVGKKNQIDGTINPFEQTPTEPEVVLVPLDETLTPAQTGEIVIDEDLIALNRENLDPKNKTITSKTQAIIQKTKDGFAIKNRSELKRVRFILWGLGK